MFSSPCFDENWCHTNKPKLEFSNFHTDSALKAKFSDSSLNDFYTKYVSPQKYPIDSTYHHEQLLSLMKNIKSRSRMHLTDEHMKVCIWSATTEILCNNPELRKQKHYPVSDTVKENYYKMWSCKLEEWPQAVKEIETPWSRGAKRNLSFPSKDPCLVYSQFLAQDSNWSPLKYKSDTLLLS
jgi:hypothetical protein